MGEILQKLLSSGLNSETCTTKLAELSAGVIRCAQILIIGSSSTVKLIILSSFARMEHYDGI